MTWNIEKTATNNFKSTMLGYLETLSGQCARDFNNIERRSSKLNKEVD